MTPESIAGLLKPYLVPQSPTDSPHLYAQLAVYLDLILKWNARINLTAIRTPEEIVRRHFGESLFAGAHIGPCRTLLDFGSGAGFPGVPIQLLRRELSVTLAESQNKKTAFLREMVRTLGLQTEVWPGRVEEMPKSRRFDTVTLRAVDKMDAAVAEAGLRASEQILILGTKASVYPILSAHFDRAEPIPMPETLDGTLITFRRR